MRNGATGWSSCETTRSLGVSRNGFMVFPSEQTKQTGSTQGTCHTFWNALLHIWICVNQKSTSSVVITDESFTSSWNQGDHNPYLSHVGPWIKSLNLLLPKHLEVNHWLRRLKTSAQSTRWTLGRLYCDRPWEKLQTRKWLKYSQISSSISITICKI